MVNSTAYEYHWIPKHGEPNQFQAMPVLINGEKRSIPAATRADPLPQTESGALESARMSIGPISGQIQPQAHIESRSLEDGK